MKLPEIYGNVNYLVKNPTIMQLLILKKRKLYFTVN